MKKELRKELLGKRNNISAAERKIKNDSVIQRLQELAIYKQAYTVLFYVSFGSEVDTHPLIKKAFKDKKRVAVPLVNGQTLDIKQITSFSQLKPGAMGILEPSEKQPSINPAEINVIIVPGIAFDKKHFRLGYGGGYYDRLLSQYSVNHQPSTVNSSITSIGLAFQEQIVEKLPVDKHDQKVDFIITDKKLI